MEDDVSVVEQFNNQLTLIGVMIVGFIFITDKKF
jgi:hypothetical protein